MEYNDEQILNSSAYELMARAYASAMKEKGFMFVQVDNEKNRELIEDTFASLGKIKSCLFFLGGFLGTGRFYSLNERQIKKLEVIFDKEIAHNQYSFKQDKTSAFLEFIGSEAHLIKNLIALSSQSSFEHDILKIINDRLTLFSETFKV